MQESVSLNIRTELLYPISFPTEHFAVLEQQNPEIGDLCVVQKRRFSDLGALNLQNVWSSLSCIIRLP